MTNPLPNPPRDDPPSAPALSALLADACRNPDPARREAAFAELLRLVMIFVRSSMGRRLRNQRESMDVCQSIARSFVEDFDAGKVRFENEAALASYLQRVVRSKLADLARSDGAAKRGGGDAVASFDGARDHAMGGIGGKGPSQSPGASFGPRQSEALSKVMSELTPDEQSLVRLRLRGLEWEQIARELGRDAGALRQQFSRLQRRVEGAVNPGQSEA